MIFYVLNHTWSKTEFQHKYFLCICNPENQNMKLVFLATLLNDQSSSFLMLLKLLPNPKIFIILKENGQIFFSFLDAQNLFSNHSLWNFHTFDMHLGTNKVAQKRQS